VTQTQAAWRAEVIRVRDENQKLDDQIRSIASMPAPSPKASRPGGTTAAAELRIFGIETADEAIAKLQELKEANLKGLESQKPKKESADVEEEQRSAGTTRHSRSPHDKRDRSRSRSRPSCAQYTMIGASEEELIQSQLATDIAQNPAGDHALPSATPSSRT
jgi:hypothetical protein